MGQRDEFAASSLSDRQVASSATQTNPSHHYSSIIAEKPSLGYS
jgi:hypothetical protein